MEINIKDAIETLETSNLPNICSERLGQSMKLATDALKQKQQILNAFELAKDGEVNPYWIKEVLMGTNFDEF